MSWKKLLLFGFALIGLFLLTGTASAAETTQDATITTLHATVYIDENDTTTGDIMFYWPYEGGFYAKNGLFGLGEGYYFVAVVNKDAAIYTYNLVYDLLVEDGASIRMTLTPATSMTVSNDVILVYTLETAPSVVNGSKIVSFKPVSVISTVSGANFSWTGALTAPPDVAWLAFTSVRTAKTAITTSGNMNAVFIPLFEREGDVTMSYVVVVNGVARTFQLGTNLGHVVEGADEFYGVYGAVNYSITPIALILDQGLPVIVVDAYDALSATKAIVPTLIIGSETYTHSATVTEGVCTLTITAEGYDATTVVITADEITTYSTLVSMFPETAIFSVSHFSAVRGYQGGLISDVIVISPRSSFTNNVTMQFINFPFSVTAIVDGSTSVLSGNNLLLGAVNGEKVITIIMSAAETTQAQAYIELIGNDAFTGTASMSFAEFIAVLPVPFNMTTPAVWVLGTNYVRIANDTNTMTITFIVKNAGGTEIYNKIVTLTPLQIYTFSPLLDEGQNSVYINFTYLSDAGLITGTESGSIFFIAEAHKQAAIDYSVLTVTYNVINTATVTVTNPFGMVGTYTVFIQGNWGTETGSKVIAILPNSTATVSVYFDGPSNEEISAYEATIWVVYNNATVFSTTVPVTATTAPGFFGTGISQNDVIYIIIGLVAVGLLIIAIRRGDEL